MYKHLCLSIMAFFLSFVSTVSIAQSQPSANDIVKEATTLAAKQHKNVFIMFHASWCSWCHKMDTILNSAEVKPLFDKYFVTRHIDVSEPEAKKNLETPGGTELLKQYNGDKQGVPFWFILDGKGKFLTDSRIRPEGSDVPGGNTGCPAQKDEIDYWIRVLKQTSKLSDDQLTTIARAFGKIRGITY